jgi:hypothetical protein
MHVRGQLKEFIGYFYIGYWDLLVPLVLRPNQTSKAFNPFEEHSRNEGL